MLILKADYFSCGHCGKKDPKYDMRRGGVSQEEGRYSWPAYAKCNSYAVGVCRNCDNHSLFIFNQSYYNHLTKFIDQIESKDHFQDRFSSYHGSIYPEPTNFIDSQQGYPEEVVNHLLAAQELKTKNNSQYASAILSSCRTALEIAIKHIKDEKGEFVDFEKHPNLHNKIMCLRELNLITREIYEWSSHVRIEGNKAVHEGKASSEEATECFEFVNLFCHIVFTLPALIKQKQSTDTLT